MELLIEKKALVQQASQQGTALASAAGQCQLGAMQFLLDRGVTVTAGSDCAESTLVQAVKRHAKETESCQGHAGEAPHNVFSDVLALLRNQTPTSPDCRGLRTALHSFRRRYWAERGLPERRSGCGGSFAWWCQGRGPPRQGGRGDAYMFQVQKSS